MIPVNTPLLNGNELEYVTDCINSGWISSEGSYVAKFENLFSNYVGRKYGVAVSNGTTAIDIVIEALKFGPNDEIIIPTFTIISCISQIVRCGATPVFVDSEIDTWNMNVEQIESKITKNTKAIFVVHIYGLPVEMDKILLLAKKYNLLIIEDAAEMHGQTYNGLPCGSFGDVSIFSFYANKNITTGEGGMIVTNSSEIYANCKDLRNLCFKPDDKFVHDRLGWNYRMTNIQAAIGVAQLERIEHIIKRKREIGNLYQDLLSNIEYLQLPLKKHGQNENIYWVFGLLINEKSGYNSKSIMKKLYENNIMTRPFFCPLHKQPFFKNSNIFKNYFLPVSEKMYNEGFYLPSGLGITDTEIEIVSTTLKKIIS
jgi:perosamine synthetase